MCDAGDIIDCDSSWFVSLSKKVNKVLKSSGAILTYQGRPDGSQCASCIRWRRQPVPAEVPEARQMCMSGKDPSQMNLSSIRLHRIVRVR